MTRGLTGHTGGTVRRTVTREQLQTKRAALLAQPPSPERSVGLRRVRSALGNLDRRSERHA